MDWVRVRKYVETEPVFTYGTPQESPVVTTISVTPSDVDLAVGETCQFTATAYDDAGNVVDITFTWESSNETVGTVTEDGVFSANYDGTTEISASAGSITVTAQVTVIPVSDVRIGMELLCRRLVSGWSSTASWTCPNGACAEYGPVMVDGHGEHGADVHLSAGAVIASVEHNFTDPSGVGWDGLALVARVGGSSVPSGRWMTIEVNGELVYSESGFSSLRS